MTLGRLILHPSSLTPHPSSLIPFSVSRRFRGFSATTAAAAAAAVAPPPAGGTAALVLPARRGSFAAPGAGGLVLFAEKGLSRQLHAVLVVDGDHLDLQAVAHLADVFDLVHVLVVQLADVAEPVPAGQDLDEGAEVLDRGDPPVVHFADADLFGQ